MTASVEATWRCPACGREQAVYIEALRVICTGQGTHAHRGAVDMTPRKQEDDQ
jgi:hypothetical protein